MATPMPWVKLYTEMLDDFKLIDLDDAVKWRFIQLILLAGECDDQGYLTSGGEAISEKKLAARLRIDPNQFKKDIATLTEAGLLSEDVDTGAILVVKFRDRQGRPQKEKREQWRDRQQQHREQQGNVMHDSRMTHAPRVDKSREDKIINSTDAAEALQVFTTITGMAAFPSQSEYQDISRIGAIVKDHGVEGAIDFLKPYYSAWITRKRKDGKQYSRLNTNWLDWAIAREIPEPYSDNGDFVAVPHPSTYASEEY